MPDDIDTKFRHAIESGKINGAVICATNNSRSFTYDNPIGHRTLLSGEKIPQRMDDVLFLASATKLITTIAALQCVDDGLITLTGNLSSIVPELASKQIITGFTAEDEPILEKTVHKITLEMLITHSSGVTYHFLNPLIAKWRKKYQPVPQGDGRRGVEEAFSYPLGFQPGESWMYSPGLDWAGRIVEKLTAKTLGQHIRERICTPLGIDTAEFHPVQSEELRARLVDLNPQDPEGLGRAVLGGDAEMNKRSRGDFGGHGLFMSGADYLKVLQSLLANDGKILKPETVNDMFEDHLSPQAQSGFQIACAGPGGQFFRVGVEQGTKMGYGLGGLVLLEDVDGWYGDRTLTWGGGMTFAWFIDRKNDLCGVGAVQASLPVDFQVIGELKQTFRRDIYRKYHAANHEANV